MADRTQPKYTVVRSFVENNTYITNDNVHLLEKMDSKVVSDRLRRGFIRSNVPNALNGPGGGDLFGVNFASDEAAELANRLGLSAVQFENVEASGQNGFTVSDVRDLNKED
jgi:hypothetical protein